ncbi:MAG: hypothetical protein LUC17_05215 [Oscillospiraceae bacterium]|nr:hypothetical protein [Oscillospiraceae bacterium]
MEIFSVDITDEQADKIRQIRDAEKKDTIYLAGTDDYQYANMFLSWALDNRKPGED